MHSTDTPAASKEKAPSNLGEIIAVYLKQSPPSPHESLQAGMANVTVHSRCSPSPTLSTPEKNSTRNPRELQTNSITLPDNVLHLQEEMNNAMVHLLTFRASVDTCQQRLISELEIAHCQNETKASKAINGVETHYAVALHDTKAVYAAAMRETEATHLERQRPPVPPWWGKQRLPGQHKHPSYDKSTWKQCELWKTRSSKRKGTLANTSCWPVEHLFRPVPTKP